jgi:hypothetical protein
MFFVSSWFCDLYTNTQRQLAWTNSAKDCFGHDTFNPISLSCENTLHGGFMRKFIANSFSPHGDCSLFEFIIRYLGGCCRPVK